MWPRYRDRLICDGLPYEEGGDWIGCSIDNDYLIVNDEPQVSTLPISGDVSIKLVDWDDCCEAVPATRATLAERAADLEMLPLVSVTVAADGAVHDVTEIYTP